MTNLRWHLTHISFGVRVQVRLNQLQKETLHYLTLLIQDNFFIRTKHPYSIKLMDICYNKGLIIQIITTQKICKKSSIMIGCILQT